MEIFKPINEKKAKGKVKKIFSEIKKQEKYQKYQIFGDRLHIILHCLKELGIVLKQL